MRLAEGTNAYLQPASTSFFSEHTEENLCWHPASPGRPDRNNHVRTTTRNTRIDPY